MNKVISDKESKDRMIKMVKIVSILYTILALSYI